ncbi:hypothetical protein M758_UG068700 [Ceratodon purpureus]|nr:hypothetical protein M758_UG068700 [Ceratodon purpureus]
MVTICNNEDQPVTQTGETFCFSFSFLFEVGLWSRRAYPSWLIVEDKRWRCPEVIWLERDHQSSLRPEPRRLTHLLDHLGSFSAKFLVNWKCHRLLKLTCGAIAAIDIPSIIEKGSRDEFVELEGGGRIHLRMCFVLTDEERKKIETMRLSTMKRREEERLQRTVVFQTVQPTFEKKLSKSPVSSVTITEVDASTTDGRKAPKVTENGPLGFGSTTKPLVPMPMFDYARAVGSQASRCFIRTERGFNAGGSFNSGIAVKAINDDMNLQEQSVGEHTNVRGKGRNDSTESANDYQEVERRIDSQRARNTPAADAWAVAICNIKDCVVSEGQLEKGSLSGDSTYMTFRERMQNRDRFLRPRAAYTKTEFPKFEDQSGQGIRSEARSGPGARWAQKSGLETTWTSPKKARRILREEWNGHVTDPLKARAKIFELIKLVGFSHESYSDRSFQEHQSISDSVGAVFHKVVGGAAMLLAALFMMWPIVEGAPDGYAFGAPWLNLFMHL